MICITKYFLKFLQFILRVMTSSDNIWRAVAQKHWFSGYDSSTNTNQHKICFPTVYNLTCFAGKKFHSNELLMSSITWLEIVAPTKFRIKFLKKTAIPSFMLLTRFAVSTAHSEVWDNWQPCKNDEDIFLFHLKSSFFSQDI